MIRTQISLTEDQAEHLRVQAAAQGVSQAALLRRALDAYLDNLSLSGRVQRARLPVGAFWSGCASLSEDHDEALDEAFSA